MLDNDGRTSEYGISLGDRVDYRWGGLSFQGTVIRLTSSKAVIKTGAGTGHSVNYKQIRQSTKYSD